MGWGKMEKGHNKTKNWQKSKNTGKYFAQLLLLSVLIVSGRWPDGGAGEPGGILLLARALGLGFVCFPFSHN